MNNPNNRWGNNPTLDNSTSAPPRPSPMNTYTSTYYSNAPLMGSSATGSIVTNSRNTTAINSSISPNNNLGLRKRDGFAILTCLFLLRLAFTPSDGSGGGAFINFADSSVGASMELAFYSPFRSTPPKTTISARKKINGDEKTARPVPLDIDGDGVVEAMVVPVFLKREEVAEEIKDLKDGAQKSNRRYGDSVRNDDEDNGKLLSGWERDGSWGLRILNLKPLHRRRDDNSHYYSEEGAVAGPFAPRSMFLAPLLRFSSKEELENKDGKDETDYSRTNNNSYNNNNNNNNNNKSTYPLKLLSIQIPIQRTQLGEDEKSRQRHKRDSSYTGTIYGTGSGPPPRDDPNHKNYDRTRHYFCGRDWHHASQSCHKHCPSGVSSECGEGETCYADTPCDALLGSDSDNSSNDMNNLEETPEMALTPRGTLPGIVTVWSDGSVSLHVITADISSSSSASNSNADGKQAQHRAKRTRQKNKKPDLELRQLWRVYPLESSENIGNGIANGIHLNSGEGSEVYFDELGVAFESGAIYGVATIAASGEDGKRETKKTRIGDHGAILLGGRYTLESKGQSHPLKVSFHALDALTGASLWELKANRDAKRSSKSPQETDEGPKIPIIHTTSSARRRSHLPTSDAMDPDLDNENAFVEGEDVMTSESCLAHFRASVLDGDSGALPHEFWGDNQGGSISVGRFDRTKRSGRNKGRSPIKKGRHTFHKKPGSYGEVKDDSVVSAINHVAGGNGAIVGNRGGPGSGRSWQSDLINRAVPRRLVVKQRYNAIHPHIGKPNVVLFHGSDGLAVLSLKNGHPVCHVSLTDHALYADVDQDGVIDNIQVVTSPEGFSKSSGIQMLIQRITKSASVSTDDENRRRGKPDAPVICHALVMSGLPPREELFTAPLCLGGPLMSVNPSKPQAGLSAAPPLLVEGSLGYGYDVVFAMNNGVVARYDFNGREVWRKKGGLSDGTPTWSTSDSAFLGRIQFGAVRELHTSVSASAHRNQHRPGSPARPILLSGEDGAALISPASGKVLSSIVYPQSITSQPLLSDLDGDGTDDLLVVSSDAIWGYRVLVETGRSGFFSLVVVTVVIGVALAALVHKTSQPPGRLKRSMDA
ncbi:hypothetical protein ACHAXS_009173 [Conticribra weissflogii]